jgi:hypothetical protein
MRAIGRLALAIGYPQEVPADSVDFSFKVDGGEIRALDLEKRLVLLREISREEDELLRLASHTVGRILREDAILYWDERIGAVVLSQDIPVSATAHELKAFFETFADCNVIVCSSGSGAVGFESLIFI